MSITRLPEIVFPLTQVNKVNEIVDVLNDNLNMYFSSTNPALTPVEGVATWTVTHNLGTENINCTIFEGDNLVISNVSITSENIVTVSFNATTSIAQDTYKIVIISNGAGSSSGSGSYVLPTASITTLGGVRIDGSSITINNGVISSTVDSTLSSTSTNPVQNKVLYPSLNGFLPSGTIINVKTDGSGDFTSLTDAINYLTGKWSNGTVTIQLGNGTFNDADLMLNTLYFNIPYLKIYGNGVSNTTLYSSSQSGSGFQIIYGNSTVELNGFTYKKPATSIQSSGVGIRPTYMSNVRILDVTVEGCGIAIGTVGSNYCNIIGNISIKWANLGVDSHQAGFLKVTDAHINFNNVNTAFNVRAGGRLQALSPIVTYTNVTNKVSQTVGTATNNGWITGITV